MKTAWSSSWKASKQPRKQRKYVYNAPMHTRRKLLGAHLSKELREKYGTRSVMLKTGDKVKVMRGAHKNHIGKIDRVDATDLKVYIVGVELTKKDGSKISPPFRPSNLMITELELDDRKREMSITRKGGAKSKVEEPKPEPKPEAKPAAKPVQTKNDTKQPKIEEKKV